MSSNLILPNATQWLGRAKSLLCVGVLQISLTACTFFESELPQPLPKPTATYDSVVPLPVSFEQGREYFSLTPNSLIKSNDNSLQPEITYLNAMVKQTLGFELATSDSFWKTSPSSVELILKPSTQQDSEAYDMVVTEKNIQISASTRAGIFRGIQSLKQLLPTPTESKGNPNGLVWTIYTGEISDQPRYAYRGFMLDVSRHFYSVDEVKTIIDYLAEYKYNVFHFHLTDDQGWRIEIPGWPKLTSVGSRSAVGMEDCDNCYYTLEQYADIVAYADARHITLIPEIDTPGHVRAAQASYPELLYCDGDKPEWPYTGIKVKISSLCFKNPDIYDFFNDVVAAIAPLTTGPYIHVGGDETPKWVDKKDYREFMLRAQFIIASHGKKMMGWTNDLGNVKGLPENVLGQHWSIKKTCCETTLNMVAQGNQIVMSPANKTYLDLKYNKDTKLGLKWAGFNDVENSYNWNPATMVEGVNEDHILGIEAPLWGETVNSLEDAEYLIFPRLLTLAEVAWSPQEQRQFDSFQNRLDKQVQRLKQRGVNVHLQD